MESVKNVIGKIDFSYQQYFELDCGSNVSVTEFSMYGGYSVNTGLKVTLPKKVFDTVKQDVEVEFNKEIGKHKGKSFKFKKGLNYMERTLGQELIVLLWAIEDCPEPEFVSTALSRWNNLKPTERWWLYNMTNSFNRENVDSDNVGWRKALKCALCGRG